MKPAYSLSEKKKVTALNLTWMGEIDHYFDNKISIKFWVIWNSLTDILTVLLSAEQGMHIKSHKDFYL